MKKDNTPVESYARSHGLTPEAVIEDIRNGDLSGYIDDGKWYVRVVSSSVETQGNASVPVTKDIQRVVITDIRMSFESMVVFMVKWAIASIPAMIILMVVFTVVSSIFVGLFTAAGRY